MQKQWKIQKSIYMIETHTIVPITNTFIALLKSYIQIYKFKQCSIFKDELWEHVDMWLVNDHFISIKIVYYFKIFLIFSN